MFRCLFISVLFLAVSALQADYYWRDYDGQVPSDALPVESDVPAVNRTYIGQGLIRNHGIFMGSLYPGKKELVTAAWGVRTTTAAVKILCTGHPKQFTWYPTNATSFFEEVDSVPEKVPVVGGLDQVVEETDEVIHVGRYKDDSVGDWTVGIIGGQDPHRRVFSYARRRSQVQLLEFEVLIYNITPAKENNEVVPAKPEDKKIAVMVNGIVLHLWRPIRAHTRLDFTKGAF